MPELNDETKLMMMRLKYIANQKCQDFHLVYTSNKTKFFFGRLRGESLIKDDL